MKLIVGVDSTIGRALSEYWTRTGVPHHASTRRKNFVSEQCPYIDLKAGQWPDDLSLYDSAVLCAAISRLADCENDPEGSRLVNVTNTFKLAQNLNSKHCFVLFLSTNQVFDGSKPFRKTTESVSPINEYGRQKAEAEQLLLKLENLAVLRLTKVVYPEMPLLQKWKQDLMKGKEIYPFSDMTLSPIWLEKVIQSLDSLAHSKQYGIVHLSGEQDLSYFEFAFQLYQNLQKYPQQIKRTSYKNTSLVNAIIPDFTSLSTLSI